MSFDPPTNDESIPITLARDVEQICGRFEAAWARRERPRIEDYLGDTAEPGRSTLLRELILLDIHHRRVAGEHPSSEEYLGRFPSLDPSWIASTVPGRSAAQDSTTIDEQPQPAIVATASHCATVPGYEILEELGRGGMGVVYKARQTSLNRLVALKMILAGPHAGTGELARFRADAETLARLKHPNIVPIYEIGEQEGRAFFSLEFVEAGSLAGRLRGTPQNGRASAQLVETLARAMHAVHLQGIVHRDLKPGNVLLAPSSRSDAVKLGSGPDDSGTYEPKITDFGLAKQLDSGDGRTESNQILGTPSYMAPEQAMGRAKDIAPAADIYALGAILYELLTGRPPFKGETPLDTVEQVIHAEPVPPRRLQPTAPRDLETICLRCLEKEPQRRYASAEELAEDLRRFQAREPILARPVSLWERSFKWARRRPVAAALVGVSMLAAASVMIGVVVFAAYEHQKQENAQRELDDLRHITGLENEVQAGISRGEAAIEADQWQTAEVALAGALKLIESEPRLRRPETKSHVQQLLEQARRGQAEQLAIRNDQARYEEFVNRRDDAFFYESQFTGLELAANQEATRAAARIALDVFGLAPGLASASQAAGHESHQAALPSDRTYGSAEDQPIRANHSGYEKQALQRLHLGDADKVKIATSCYELLLILAEAVAQPLASEEPTEQARDAIRILDFAIQLRPATRAYHLRRAKYLDQLGDSPAAAAERGQAATLGPSDAIDYFMLGDDAYNHNKLVEAISAFKETLRREPDHFWARYLLAVCYLKLQRFDQAEIALTACQSRQAKFAWIYILRGLAYSELGVAAARASNDASAAQNFTAAETDFKTALDLLEVRRSDEARYAILVNRAAVRIQQQYAAPFSQREYAGAMQDLEEAIGLYPSRFHAYVTLARVFQDQKEYRDAVDQLDKAIELKPTLGLLYHGRGILRLLCRDLSAAAADFQETVRILDERGSLTETEHKVLVDAHMKRGVILWQQKQLEEAQKALTTASRLKPDNALAHALRGGVLYERKLYAEAVSAFDQYFANEPQPVVKAPQIREFVRSDLGTELESYREAFRDFNEYFKKGRRPAAILYEARGLAKVKLKKYAEAVTDFSRALELEPKSPDTYRLRGWVYVQLEAPKLAEQDFDQVLKLDQRNADAYNGRGYARVMLGELRKGTDDADEAVRVAPGDGREAADKTYKAARIYALALGKLAADPRVPTRFDLETRDGYRSRALELIREAMDLLPDENRTEFWQENVRKDGVALKSIAGSRGFKKLDETYGKPTQ